MTDEFKIISFRHKILFIPTLAGSILLVALFYNNLSKDSVYPKYWSDI